MNVPIILGYTDSFPKPAPAQAAPEATWFEQRFVMLGSWFIVLVAVTFSLAPVFV